MDTLFSGEASLYIVWFGFFSLLLIIGWWECIASYRPLTLPKRVRWPGNFLLGFINVLIIRAWLPVTAVEAAKWAHHAGWGLLNQVQWPFIISVLFVILIMDFMIYWQHILFHHINWFWRIHRVHHGDLNYDLSTGLRFHPFEMILSMLLKIATVILIGAPVVAVIIYEFILASCAIFTHSNIRIYPTIEGYLRYFMVTPNMHRIHHSKLLEEANCNFGNFLSIWDKLFGTYRRSPKAGFEKMQVGLREIYGQRAIAFRDLFKEPFR